MCYSAKVRPELFVAYADSDSAWVHGFLLPELGLDPQSVLTPQDFTPGAAVVQELERAVVTARFTVLVLSPGFGMSQWSALAEQLASHDSLRRNVDWLVPVLLEPYELPLHLAPRRVGRVSGRLARGSVTDPASCRTGHCRWFGQRGVDGTAGRCQGSAAHQVRMSR